MDRKRELSLLEALKLTAQAYETACLHAASVHTQMATDAGRAGDIAKASNEEAEAQGWIRNAVNATESIGGLTQKITRIEMEVAGARSN